jgi:galactose mutarotase-like enzyme
MTHHGFATDTTVSDEWTYRGFTALILENEHLRTVILPGHGARVVELVSKWARRDMLYHHPRVHMRAPVFGANADDWWTGGIDEVLPTGHPCVVDGEQLPFLGEVWSQPWQHRITANGPDAAGVTLSVGCVITPLLVERAMELRRGERILRSHHRITNVGKRTVPFMWGIHPGLSIRPGTRILVPASEGVYWEGADELGLERGTRFAWPRLATTDGRSIDLSIARPSEPPSWELVHALDLAAGWLAVIDPETRSGFGMAFDPTLFPAVWLWGVYGGWRGLYTAAVECWTSWPPRLDDAIVAGRQRVLEPGQTLETDVLFVVIDDKAEVDGISADGVVTGR